MVNHSGASAAPAWPTSFASGFAPPAAGDIIGRQHDGGSAIANAAGVGGRHGPAFLERWP
jgi:hypothetical protein